MPADRPSSRRKKQLAKLKEGRADAAERRGHMLQELVTGGSYHYLAQKYAISVKTVRREIDRALHARDLDAPDRYVRLQVERLNYAISTIDHALAEGDYHAVDALLKVIEKLDRYHGIGRQRPEAPEASRRLAAAVAPLALVDGRQVEVGGAGAPPTPPFPLPARAHMPRVGSARSARGEG
jgi:hypothetical protein